MEQKQWGWLNRSLADITVFTNIWFSSAFLTYGKIAFPSSQHLSRAIEPEVACVTSWPKAVEVPVRFCRGTFRSLGRNDRWDRSKAAWVSELPCGEQLPWRAPRPAAWGEFIVISHWGFEIVMTASRGLVWLIFSLSQSFLNYQVGVRLFY